MKYVLFTLANCVNKLQEIVEGSKKTSARFKSFLYVNSLWKSQQKKEDWIFVKRRKLDFDNILVLEGLS